MTPRVREFPRGSVQSSMDNYVFDGGTAVVTGAASGIGEALVHALAARNSDVLLVDRDAERLSAVAAGVRASNRAVDVRTRVADLSDAVATSHCAHALLSECPRITLLVNNAGVGLAGRFDEVTVEEFEWVMNINFRAPVILAHGLLPALKAQRGSHLVNISSILGLIAVAGQTAYCSSKFALRGLSDALRLELAPHGVGVTSVHPAGVRTRIVESARVGSGVSQAEAEAIRSRFARALTIDPSAAARTILDGVERRRPRVLVGREATWADVVARVAPNSSGLLLTALLTARANWSR